MNLARLAEPELFKKNSVDYYIEEGITKLVEHADDFRRFLLLAAGQLPEQLEFDLRRGISSWKRAKPVTRFPTASTTA